MTLRLICIFFFVGASLAAEPRQEVLPYLLPADHPAKAPLDQIFDSPQVVSSAESLKEAGFFFAPPRDNKRLIAAKHPHIPGYMVKLFLDSQTRPPTLWKDWIHRIKGAQLIQESIDKHGFQHILKVPKKWIYHLPHPVRYHYILVVEDMHIVTAKKNASKYHKATKKQLDALYVILTENRLVDSIYIDNIPFSEDGRIAFIDTEHYLTSIKPLRLDRLLPHFSPSMQQYWTALINSNKE